MKHEHIKKYDKNTCWLACIESFLKSQGKILTQQEMIDAHQEICAFYPNQHGLVPTGKEIDLCNKLKIQYEEVGTCSCIENIYQYLDDQHDFILCITFKPDQMHAVLFDSFDESNNISIMDPDNGYTTLNIGYPEIVEAIVNKLSYTPSPE